MTLIDFNKKELLESKYDTVCIDGQFAIVSKNMKFGCVNFVRKYKIDEHHVVSSEILEDKDLLSEENIVLPLEYDTLSHVSGRYFIVSNSEGYSCIKVGYDKVITPYRKLINLPHLEVLRIFYNGDEDRDKYYDGFSYYGYDLPDFSPLRLDSKQEPTSTLFISRIDNKVHLINEITSETINVYDDIKASDGYFETTVGNCYGAISMDAEEVLECVYRRVEMISSEQYKGYK